MPLEEAVTRDAFRRLMGQAYGKWYWLKRGRDARKKGEAALYPHATQEEIVAEILKYRKYRRLVASAPPEQNEYGNFVYRGVDANERLGIWGAEARYKFDSELGPEWKQYDTREDAWYFGIWVDIKGRRVFTYAEGDRALVECPSLESFKAELDSMGAFYGPPPPAFITCDSVGLADGKFVPEGNVQLYYDKRPSL